MARRYFHAHETARMEELEGLPLASFGQRVIGYLIDMILMAPLTVLITLLWARYGIVSREWKWNHTTVRLGGSESNEWIFIVAALFCIALVTYFSNGRSVGKWIARTRVVSLTGKRLGLWQCVERILGYGTAMAEGGLGFIQFHWSPNRMCVQDRLAETIVVDVRKASQLRTAEPPQVEIKQADAVVAD